VSDEGAAGTNAPTTIGLTLFREAKCPCINGSKQIDCADELESGVYELLQGYGKLRHTFSSNSTIPACKCHLHSRGDGYSNIHQSCDLIASYVQCDRVELTHLFRPCGTTVAGGGAGSGAGDAAGGGAGSGAAGGGAGLVGDYLLTSSWTQEGSKWEVRGLVSPHVLPPHSLPSLSHSPFTPLLLLLLLR